VTPQRWNRVRAIFDSAVDLPREELDRYLREACEGDEALLAELRQMLGQHDAAGMLDTPVAPRPRSFRADEVVAGRYRILRELGRGGMGQVYEAEDTELHEHIALKTLLPEVAADTGMVARFKREIQLARKIGHANVCRVFDLARHPADSSSPDATLFLTMEFLPGETLAGRLEREGRLSAAEALPLLEQMAEALDAAHRAGIIHRDFKPANVMLVGGGRGAVVTDFGLAHAVDISTETTATKSGQLVGTIDYMAPELFTGSAASTASDIYALGLVAYKMVTGKLPFESDSPLAGVVRRAGHRPPSAHGAAPDLDPAWDPAFARALDPDPGNRFPTCAAFVDALRGRSQSVTLSLPRLSRRKTVAVAVGVFLLIASPFAWRAWERARNRPSPEAEALYQQGVADLHAGAYFAATKALGQAVTLAPHYTLAHARLAEAWVGLDLTEKATQEMLIVRREDLSALSRLERLQVEAIDFTITREFARAAAKYEEMLRSGPPAPDDVEVDLGRAYENAGEPERAIAEYRKAAESEARNAAAWLALGVLYSRGGNTAKAEEAYQHAEERYRTSNSLEGLTELAFQRGTAASVHDQFQAASGYLRQALETARLAGNIHQEVRTKLYLSSNAYRSGDSAAAEQYARDGLETARLNRIDSLAVRGLVALGLAYARKGDWAGAEKYDQEGLTLARSGNSARLTAYSLLALASAHNATGRYADSEGEAAEALAFYEANGFPNEASQCLTILGRARLRGADDVPGALKYFQRSSAAAQKAGDSGSAALAEESMGAALTVQQKYPEAIPHFQKELELSPTLERRGYAARNLGDALAALRRYSDAEQAFQTAESAASQFPALELTLIRSRALMELSQGHYREAKALASQALADKAGDDLRLHSDLTGILGLAYAGSGDFARGVRLCRESLQDAIKLNQAAFLLRARLGLGQALIDAGDRSAALGVLQDGEPGADKFPEARWRLLALMSRADPRYAAPARDALNELERLWGSEAFRQYLAGRDVQKLSSPLFQPNHAIH